MASQETLLPPGFRFHPTDEELILHYLRNRAASIPCLVSVVAEVDIYKFDPWELPAKAMYGDREWYFFSPRERKYPNGVRPNRAAGSGYWKATGTDKVIAAGGESIGVKKALVFYKGRPPKGAKTNWIMHEYRLAETPGAVLARPLKPSRDSSMRLDDWVLCRIYKKSDNLPSLSPSHQDQEEYSNAGDAHFAAGSAGGAPWSAGGAKLPKSFSFGELLDEGDCSVLARLLYENPLDMAGPGSPDLGPILGHASPSQAALLNPCGDGGAVCFTLPQLAPVESPVSATGSCLKRRRGAEDAEDGGAMSKKPNSTCTDYTSFGGLHLNASAPQCSLLSSPFLHPQLRLNSHLGLH